MNRDRWAYIKALSPTKGSYLHISCEVAMLPNPDPLKPSTPWIQKPGTTYDVGRNAAKRARRLADKAVA